jgi:hypothetical protein
MKFLQFQILSTFGQCNSILTTKSVGSHFENVWCGTAQQVSKELGEDKIADKTMK